MAVRSTGPVLSDPEPDDRARARRKAGKRTSGAEQRESSAAVAVLDKPDSDADGEEPTDVEDSAAPVEETVEDSGSQPAAEADDPPRRRSTPEPGTAAERAAARRAKMRAEQDKRDGKGER